MAHGTENPNRRGGLARYVAVLVLVALCSLVTGYALGLLTARQVMGWLGVRQFESRREAFINRPAPPILGTTVDGKTWSLAEQRGRVVVVDFTASWCGPCVASIPFLRSLYDKHSANERFSMVSIALDAELQPLRDQIEEVQIRWPVLFEAGKTFDNSIARSFHVRGIPSMWVVDQDGQIAGLDLSRDDLEALLDRLLEKSRQVER